MNDAHPHLLTNHVSLFSLAIGVSLLAVSLWRRSPELRVASTALFLMTGLFGWVAFESGEHAADVIEALDPGAKTFIHDHALAAVWARGSGTLVACVALATEFTLRRREVWGRRLQWLLLLLGVHGCTVFAATALLGGRVRHTEVRDEAAAMDPVTSPAAKP